MIIVRVELPVEKVPGGSNAKRVAEYRCSTMGSRTQPYDLWTDCDRFVVPVLCPVIESNLNAHPPLMLPHTRSFLEFSHHYKQNRRRALENPSP